MRWVDALSLGSIDDAPGEAADAVAELLDPGAVDLLLVFASPDHLARVGESAAELARRFPRAAIVGSTGAGVIGGGREVEHRSALSLTAASLPGVRVAPLALGPGRAPYLPKGGPPGISPTEPGLGIVLADPYTCDAGALVRELDQVLPGLTKVGALASGGGPPGEQGLLLGTEWVRAGAVACVLQGRLEAEAIVAQGCRPVGEPMIVTRVERNLIHELGGRKPGLVLEELLEGLTSRDRKLARGALFMGLEVDARALRHREGELLVRNILGLDAASGAIAVGAEVARHQVVQFLVRDAEAARADLGAQLDRHAADPTPSAALLFSCLGRGEGLYGEPNHDLELIRHRLAPGAVGGFFGSGEIGPVGEKTFVHGYTSVVGLVRPVRTAA